MDVLLLKGVVLEEGQLGAARLGESRDGIVDAPQVLPLPEVRVRRYQADVELLLVGRGALAQAAASVGQPEALAAVQDQQAQQAQQDQQGVGGQNGGGDGGVAFAFAIAIVLAAGSVPGDVDVASAPTTLTGATPPPGTAPSAFQLDAAGHHGLDWDSDSCSCLLLLLSPPPALA